MIGQRCRHRVKGAIFRRTRQENVPPLANADFDLSLPWAGRLGDNFVRAFCRANLTANLYLATSKTRCSYSSEIQTVTLLIQRYQ